MKKRFDAYVQISVGPTLHGIAFTIDDLAQAMERADLDGALVSCLKPSNYGFDAANKTLAREISGHAGIVGLARIDPWQREEALKAVRRAVEEYGLVGLHLNPWEENYAVSDPLVDPLLRYVAEQDLVVRIAAGYPVVSHALQILELAQRHPAARTLLTHGAQLDNSGLSIRDALLLAKRTTHTYFETSGVYRRDFIEDLVASIGAKRVFFGSNAPIQEIEPELERILAAHLSPQERDAVLGGSLAEYLGWTVLM